MSRKKSLGPLLLASLILMTSCCTPAAAPTPESQVTILYQENCQFVLTSTEGINVFIDVGNPSLLTNLPTEQDILLTTHSHIGHHHLTSHYDQAFGTSFPGQMLNMKAGEISSGDVAVKGIQSADGPREPDGSNYIYIIDMGGLRIVDFGGIGQDQFTQELLDELGEVDVALTQLENSYSEMNIENKKGFNLMDQVKPKMVIPTHGSTDMPTIEYAIELWTDAYAASGEVVVESSDLNDDTKLLLLGEPALIAAFKNIHGLPDWE